MPLTREFPYHLSPIVSLFFACLGSCATSTSGSTAAISIYSAPPFATLRPCAGSCLVYQGPYACGFNLYYDLSSELSCGCNPKNFCYCDSKAGASASSYISSCVNKKCGAEFPGEVTSAMDLYNGYCASANVAAAVQTSTSDVTSSTSAKSTPVGTGPNTNTNTNAKDLSPTTTEKVTAETPAPADSSAATDKKKGLAQSDVVAMAVGLGVGVPSLLLAGATFCLQRRRRERQHAANPEVYYVNL